MVQKCVVRDCGSTWYPGSPITYHAFPKDIARRKLWLSIVPLKTKFYESARICSLHFNESDYDFSRMRLNHTAVPFFKDVPSSLSIEEREHSKADKSAQLLSAPIVTDINFGFVTTTTASTSAMLTTSPEVVTHLSTPSTSSGISKSTSPKYETGIKRTLRKDDFPSNKKQCLIALGNICNVPQVDAENCPPAKIEKSVQVKLKTAHEELLQKKNKILKQKVSRQGKCIEDMESLIAVVKKYTSQTEIENIIEGRFADLCKQFKKPPTSPQGIRYSEEVKAFALTLHFYSPKAYEFVRNFTALPHVGTLRRSLSLFNCNVGFLTEVIEYLKEKVKLPENRHLKNVALIFDGMSLKQDLAYDQKLDKVIGYVDLGPIPVSDPEKLASEALVFQIVSYTKRFKCPIAYFFIQNSLAGELLSELIKSAIILLDEINITVRSLTCDGAASNVKAFECLGCSLSQNDFQTYFRHPNGRTNVYCILDAAHMLKLARNVMADFTIKSGTGDISFEYIRKLHEIQNMEGLKFSNKLSGLHVDFKNKKMNVRLAAQVLSSSVADAIDFLRVSGHPEFANSNATTEFLHMIDRLFDLMNSKSPFGKSYKSPLSLKNKCFWEQAFEESKIFLKSLTINGKNILNHPRKTFAVGFLMNITSLSLLTTDLCTMEEDTLKYLLTFKCSQDNLEIFFSCIRARGRAQDNPSPLEFRYIMRKMLFRNTIKPSVNANCVDNGFESSHILDFNKRPTTLIQAPIEPDLTHNVEEILYNLDSIETSSYQENILYYITGYIVKQIVSHVSCKYCHNMLISPDDSNLQKDHTYSMDINKYQTFTTFVNGGKLYFPSIAAYKIVKYTDKVFKQAVTMGQLKAKNIQNKLLNIILQHFTPSLQQMFKHPAPDSITCSDLHETMIIKSISNKFLKMRMRAHLKSHSERLLGNLRGKRQKLHKTIILSHV